MKQTLHNFLRNEDQIKCRILFNWEQCTFKNDIGTGTPILMTFTDDNQTVIEFKKVVLMNNTLKITFGPKTIYELNVICKISALQNKLKENPYDDILLNDSYFNVMNESDAYEIRFGIQTDSLTLSYLEKDKLKQFVFKEIEKIDYQTE